MADPDHQSGADIALEYIRILLIIVSIFVFFLAILLFLAQQRNARLTATAHKMGLHRWPGIAGANRRGCPQCRSHSPAVELADMERPAAPVPGSPAPAPPAPGSPASSSDSDENAEGFVERDPEYFIGEYCCAFGFEAASCVPESDVSVQLDRGPAQLPAGRLRRAGLEQHADEQPNGPEDRDVAAPPPAYQA